MNLKKAEQVIRQEAWKLGWSLIKDDGLSFMRAPISPGAISYDAGGEVLRFYLARLSPTGEKLRHNMFLRRDLEHTIDELKHDLTILNNVQKANL